MSPEMIFLEGKNKIDISFLPFGLAACRWVINYNFKDVKFALNVTNLVYRTASRFNRSIYTFMKSVNFSSKVNEMAIFGNS